VSSKRKSKDADLDDEAKRKPKRSRLAEEAAQKWHALRHTSSVETLRAYFERRDPIPDLPGYDPNYTGMGGPGDMSSDLMSWIEEQNFINRAIGESLRQGRGAKKKANDREIWQEFKRRRRTSKKSDSALAEEIGRKFGLKRSAAIEARKRGEKSSG
jgi:hypothetical protein